MPLCHCSSEWALDQGHRLALSPGLAAFSPLGAKWEVLPALAGASGRQAGQGLRVVITGFCADGIMVLKVGRSHGHSLGGLAWDVLKAGFPSVGTVVVYPFVHFLVQCLPPPLPTLQS